MFTGIVEQVGTISNIEDSAFIIKHGFAEPLSLGESIALNGACMTIARLTDSTFSVDIIEESRRCTSFDTARVGDLVNLERSAIIGQRNSGHNVTGHIDETGQITKLEKKSDFWCLRVSLSPKNRQYCIYKGSIAVEGISLTISELGDDWFEVSIIPHTWEHTNLSSKTLGDRLNLEYDQVGKYILNQKK